MSDTSYIDALESARTIATVTGSRSATHTETYPDGRTVTAEYVRTPAHHQIGA